MRNEPATLTASALLILPAMVSSAMLVDKIASKIIAVSGRANVRVTERLTNTGSSLVSLRVCLFIVFSFYSIFQSALFQRAVFQHAVERAF